jgi:adenosine deaminase
MKELSFLKRLPKIELHAHLNGSLTNEIILDLICKDCDLLQEYETTKTKEIKEINDFFSLFDFIYKITNSPSILTRMTRLVIEDFKFQGCKYLELRTTPKDDHMSKIEYINAVLEGMDVVGIVTRLIISINRANPFKDSLENIQLVQQLNSHLIVGIDICGNPHLGDVDDTILPLLNYCRANNIKTTFHLGEIDNRQDEIKKILQFKPDRVSHLTFLDKKSIELVIKEKIPAEICITSNLKCKTVKSIEDHHVLFCALMTLGYLEMI